MVDPRRVQGLEIARHAGPDGKRLDLRKPSCDREILVRGQRKGNGPDQEKQRCEEEAHDPSRGYPPARVPENERGGHDPQSEEDPQKRTGRHEEKRRECQDCAGCRPCEAGCVHDPDPSEGEGEWETDRCPRKEKGNREKKKEQGECRPGGGIPQKQERIERDVLGCPKRKFERGPGEEDHPCKRALRIPRDPGAKQLEGDAGGAESEHRLGYDERNEMGPEPQGQQANQKNLVGHGRRGNEEDRRGDPAMSGLSGQGGGRRPPGGHFAGKGPRRRSFR